MVDLSRMVHGNPMDEVTRLQRVEGELRADSARLREELSTARLMEDSQCKRADDLLAKLTEAREEITDMRSACSEPIGDDPRMSYVEVQIVREDWEKLFRPAPAAPEKPAESRVYKDKRGDTINPGDTLFNPWDRDKTHTVLAGTDGKLYLGDMESELSRYRPEEFWEIVKPAPEQKGE